MNSFLSLHHSLRPREKIQFQGIETLTTAELLSVILGSGSKQVHVEVLARKIADKLINSKEPSLSDLKSIKGIGIAKGCQILAAIELVERLRPSGYLIIDSLQKVLHQVGELRYAQREQIVCLYLNARMQLILKETLAVGSVNQSILSPRDVFAVIKHHPISYVILAHNHPSGDPSPSVDDLKFTQLIYQGGKILGVELIDHIIIAHEQHYSYKEQGVLFE
jgi:DNA repair protein RadC